MLKNCRSLQKDSVCGNISDMAYLRHRTQTYHPKKTLGDALYRFYADVLSVMINDMITVLFHSRFLRYQRKRFSKMISSSIPNLYHFNCLEEAVQPKHFISSNEFNKDLSRSNKNKIHEVSKYLRSKKEENPRKSNRLFSETYHQPFQSLRSLTNSSLFINSEPIPQLNNNLSVILNNDRSSITYSKESKGSVALGCQAINRSNIAIIKDNPSNVTSVLYVDSSSLWKFPAWLIERLGLDETVKDISTLTIEKYRFILMRQLRSTATDLLLYQSVRREFLRTILVIELNNVVKLMEHIAKLGLDKDFKKEFFERLRPIVSTLDDPDKAYIPEMEEMAYIIDEIYLLIAPSHIIKPSSYRFNVVYCSYLISHWAMIFNERCMGGIVDNNLLANESKYYCMVLVTPQVRDPPSKNEPTRPTFNNFRVETYFDVDRGRFSGYEMDFIKCIDPKYSQTRRMECLFYSYFTRRVHWVEDRSIFLLNGPDVKGNLDFTKIYCALLKIASF